MGGDIGEWGKVFRNNSKGHMDKTKGRVEAGKGGGFDGFGVEGWGENADNCNRTTIKYFLKNRGTFTQWDTCLLYTSDAADEDCLV